MTASFLVNVTSAPNVFFIVARAALTRLLKKNVEWGWGGAQQEAFEDLKDALVERPILAYPEFSKPFRLITDASKVDLGATLTQDQGQGEPPVAYASKINSDTVSRYSITDLECAAVIWAVKLFRPYLYGRRFELVTDHAALKWLMTPKDLTGRLHRWSLQLQEYDFGVTYRPGSSNVVAGSLSRAPVNTIRGVEPDGEGQTGESEETNNAAGREGQLTNEVIRVEQGRDKTVQKLLRKGKYGAQTITVADGVVLPAALWAAALRENHDLVYACHLRTPQTYARLAAHHWWPDMRVHVWRWEQSCRDCDSRKSKAKEVIHLLRSQEVGSPGDRWDLDVPGPLPVTDEGNRYVIAAVDYATRYVVVATVPTHTAKDVAKFIAEKLVFVHGPMREVVMDGAPELNGAVVKALVAALQAKQLTPVPYRPALLGLVERFHRSWKDIVAIYVAEEQNDWDQWVACAAYAYNGARHSGTGYSPNELMMGRKLRAPNELLRTSGVTQTGAFAEYHQALVTRMAKATEAARAALAKDSTRRAKYYNRRVRNTSTFGEGDRVWVLKPPRGRGITKLAHQWVGPAKIVQSAGYDNWDVERMDTGERVIAHCSFLVSACCPYDSMEAVADRILAELSEEEAVARQDGNGDEGDEPDERNGAARGLTAHRSVEVRDAEARAAVGDSENQARIEVAQDTASTVRRRTPTEAYASGGATLVGEAELRRDAAAGVSRARETARDVSGGVEQAGHQPGIAVEERGVVRAGRSAAGRRPKRLVKKRPRKRKPRADTSDEQDDDNRKRQRRADAGAARSESAARRRALRDEWESPGDTGDATSAGRGARGGTGAASAPGPPAGGARRDENGDDGADVDYGAGSGEGGQDEDGDGRASASSSIYICGGASSRHSSRQECDKWR